MTRILKTSVQCRFNDVALRVTEAFFGALDSPPEYVLVRSAARALFEQLGKVVRTHAGDHGELRQTEIVTQIVANVIKHTLEAIPWQTVSIDHRSVLSYGVSIQQIHRQRIGQGFAVEPPRRRARIEIGPHGKQHGHDIGVGQIPVFGQLYMALVSRFVQCVHQQGWMDRRGDAVCWPAPSELIDRTSRKDERGPGICTELERLPSCEHFILDRPLQHHVQEILDVLVPGYDAGGNRVFLESNP